MNWNAYRSLPGAEPHRLWDSGAGSGRSGNQPAEQSQERAKDGADPGHATPRDADASLGDSLRALESQYRSTAAGRYFAPDDDAADDQSASPSARAGYGAAAAVAPDRTGGETGALTAASKSAACSETQADGSAPLASAAQPQPQAETAHHGAPGAEAVGEPLERRTSEAAPTAKAPEPPTLRNTQEGGLTIDAKPLSTTDKPPRTADSGGSGGPGGGQGGGGGGRGGGGAAPFQERSSEREFREVLTKGLATCRRNLVTVAIFSFIVNALVLAVPLYLFNISDRVLTSRSTDTLLMLSLVVLGALVVHILLDMVRRFILMRIAVEAESKLGAPVLAAAAKASQGGSSREFQTLGDLQHMRTFITGPVLLTMLDAPVAPLYLLAVFLIHPDLGWIVATTGLALLVLAYLNQKITAVPFGRANAFGTRANLVSDAMARNAQVINAMGMIPEAVAMWGRETAESLKAQVLAQDRNIIVAGISKFVRLCTQIAILGWGAWLSLHSELTGGMMIAASIVGSRALAPIEGTIDGWKNFIHARAAYARIKTLLQNSTLNFDRLRLPRPEGRLNVERLLYVPPPNKKVILNGITFQLDPGDSLAIVGGSGMGKSTLARMLVGSISPTAGSVRLDQMDMRNWDTRQFGESVGYLPQDVQLFPATIKANIARMRGDATDEAIFDAAEVADVHEMISHFAQGYETQVAVDGSPLSGGQKQRIALARAFYGNPRLVVLDEPNSNLDTPGERALARALTRAKEKKITVVAVTQRPSLLKSVDKIMILKDGAVQALGKRDDIIPLLMGNKAKGGANGAGDGAALLEG